MALTKERRNEIAWLYLVNKVSQKPLTSVGELAEELKGKFGLVANDALSFAYDLTIAILQKNAIQFGTPRLDVLSRGVIAWEVLLKSKFYEGVKIGELTKRQIGNEAKQLGISTDEAMKFAKEVVTEIVKKVFA